MTIIPFTFWLIFEWFSNSDDSQSYQIEICILVWHASKHIEKWYESDWVLGTFIIGKKCTKTLLLVKMFIIIFFKLNYSFVRQSGCNHRLGFWYNNMFEVKSYFFRINLCVLPEIFADNYDIIWQYKSRTTNHSSCLTGKLIYVIQ